MNIHILPGCYAVLTGKQLPTFRRSVVPPSSAPKSFLFLDCLALNMKAPPSSETSITLDDTVKSPCRLEFSRFVLFISKFSPCTCEVCGDVLNPTFWFSFGADWFGVKV
jgi:hypothetical protein